MEIYSPVANAFASLRSPLRFAAVEMTREKKKTFNFKLSTLNYFVSLHR